MTISLSNHAGRCLGFVLSHEAFCGALGSCRCSVEAGRAGRCIASSLTLAAGHTVSELPEAVLGVPEVVRAVRRGELAVTRVGAEVPPPAVTTPVPAAASEGSRSDNKPTKKRGAG